VPSAIPAGMEAAPPERPLRLPSRSPFATDTLLSFLAARAVPGVEEVRDRTYRRSVRGTDGRSAVVAITPDRIHEHVVVDVSTERLPDLGALAHAARGAFDLDADPEAIDATLARDPLLAPLVARRPGIRVPGTVDVFELVVRAIFGQQVSVAGARTSLARFAARYGAPVDRPVGGITHLFPSPEQVAEIPLEAFGMPRARAETIHRVAELATGTDLDTSVTASPKEALERLSEVPGIGPWTLAYVAMRAFHDPDAFLAGDLGVRRGFDALGLPSTTKEILERAERWRPWRAYAVMHLWHVPP
jgi:AraC family transcriptional regulator, regulatory protein of adaptative response / DNA-3-methyladenine glycosylase II